MMTEGNERDEAIDRLTREHAGAASGTPARSRLALQLAGLRLARSMAGEGAAGDREVARQLVREITTDPATDPQIAASARMLDNLVSALGALPPGMQWDGRSLADLDFLGWVEAWAAHPEAFDVPTFARALTGLGTAGAQLTGAPPDIAAMVQLMGPLAQFVQQVNGRADGQVEPELVEGVLQTADRLPAGDLQGLLRGVMTWVKAGQAPHAEPGTPAADALTAEVTRVLAGLGPEQPVRPLLQQVLAERRVGEAERSGSVSALAEALELFESAMQGMGGPAHLLYEETQHQVVVMTLVNAAVTGDPQLRQRAESLADTLRGTATTTDHDRGRLALLDGMTALLRARTANRQDDLREATKSLLASLDLIAPDHALHPVALTLLAALLNDRHLMSGLLEDRAVAARLFRMAAARSGNLPAGGDRAAKSMLQAMALVSRVTAVQDDGDPASLEATLDELEQRLRELPDPHLVRPRLQLVLGVGRLRLGLHRSDPELITTGLDVLQRLRGVETVEFTGRSALRASGITGQLLRALLEQDYSAVTPALDDLLHESDDDRLPADQRGALRAILGQGFLARHAAAAPDGIPHDAQQAVRHLSAAVDDLPHSPLRAPALFSLAKAHRAVDPADPAGRQAAQEGLVAVASDVLLQSGAEDGLTVARGAAEEALELAHWCLDHDDVDGALRAIESGRGLVLHAATAVMDVADNLREAGRPELAREWEAELHRTPVGHDLSEQGRFLSGALGEQLPSDVRQRALEVLRQTPAAARLLGVPSRDETLAVLDEVAADALVHLLPGTGAQPGRVVVLSRAGGAVVRDSASLRTDHPALRTSLIARDRLMPPRDDQDGEPSDPDGGADIDVDPDVDPDAWEHSLQDLCAWAWTAAMGMVSDLAPRREDREVPHVVVIPTGVLAGVPWHAAGTAPVPDGARLACREMAVSYAGSVRQVADVANRAPLPAEMDPLLVGNPKGEQFEAAAEVAGLWAAFYPQAVVLGEVELLDEDLPDADAAHRSAPSEPLVAPATPDAVLARMPAADRLGASLVHIAGHGRLRRSPLDSYLELAPAEPDIEPGSPKDDASAAGRLMLRRVLAQARGRQAAAPGPLVVLSNCWSDLSATMEDEALTLATAFLAAGAVGVVASRWPVSQRLTPLLMFAFHHYLVRQGCTPAEALRRAQLWSLDERREVFPHLGPLLKGDLQTYGPQLRSLALWAAFGHHGR